MFDLSNEEESTPFDLNVERILEDWEVYHALREVIANALDEQLLSGTREIEIAKNGEDEWHVRDYGRGLQYEHLTQKENTEKLSNPNMIGRFGIGLKDALATFDKHDVKVTIRSRFGDFTIGTMPKYGFEDIETLHAYVSKKPSNPDFVGTEFTVKGVNDDDIQKAKDMFLKFSGETQIERTKYGEVLGKKSEKSRIYINGVRVAEEENFLFSYNITTLTENIRKALNRERSNVGRTAYAERVRAILVSCSTEKVATILADDLKGYSTGGLHDELKWLDVQEHAVKILSSTEKAVFLTPSQMSSETMMVDEAKEAGISIIAVPKTW